MRGCGVVEVHASSGSISLEAVPDVDVLLAVVAKREIEKRTAGRGQLHRRAEPALRQGHIACGQMEVQVGDEPPHLDALYAWKGAHVDAPGPDSDHPQTGYPASS